MVAALYRPLETTDDNDEQAKQESPSKPWYRQPLGDFSFRRALNLAYSCLAPSFLQHRSGPARQNTGSIAALDGLRGLACLCVVNQHFTQVFTSRLLLLGWGQTPDDFWLPELPFVKIFWSGSAQVCTFFVLSGYVLSIKPLRQMHSQSPQLLQTIASAIFRRGIRLFLPVFTISFFVVILAQLGAYVPASLAKAQGLVAWSEQVVMPEDSIWINMRRLWDLGWKMSNIFDWTWSPEAPFINEHLWTFVVEYRASLLLFLIHAGTSRLKTWIRVSILAWMVVYCGLYHMSYELLFFVGMLLAELDLIYNELNSEDRTSLPSPVLERLTESSAFQSLSRILRQDGFVFRAIFISIFMVGLYCCSCPRFGGPKTPGFIWLTTSFQPSWYHTDSESDWAYTIGATCLVASAVHSPDIRPIYCNAFAKYAGTVSFAVYMCHGVVIRTLLYGSLPILSQLTAFLGGRDSQAGLVVQWLLGALFVWPLVIWLADLVYRLVDAPTVRFSRWLEKACFRPEPTPI